jgi:mono/diheme cytochrome c family protein
MRWCLSLVLLLGCAATACQAETAQQRGYRLLTTKAYLPPDFDQQVFDELWKCWEEPLRSQAAAATLDERRKLAFARYGLSPSPDRGGPVAWQYVDDGRGGWVMNCLACHGGTVAGRAIAGLPNSLYDLQTLTEDVRNTKLRMKKPLSHMDRGSLGMPLSGSIGTTNAVMFGKLLLHYRDADLVVHRDRGPPSMLHHDHDAPAWWHLKRKTHLYIDGFAPKTHRSLMQFLLIPKNGPENFRAWEDDYRDILAWMESLEPPPYPWKIDARLAHEGEAAFNRTCASCHGTYGPDRPGEPGGRYPEKMVPIDTIGTDPVRHQALEVSGRRAYAHSWFNQGATVEAIEAPAGYVAPPLDGIWASAPYLHNGSVPTLWHMLRPDARPVVWRRTADGYDQTKVGLEVTTFDAMPQDIPYGSPRRKYFNTRLAGKSAAGHAFPDALSETEKRAVLEYLKTL